MQILLRRILPFCLILTYLAIFWLGTADYIQITQPFGMQGAPEEQILEHTAAKNFVDYGFFNHDLLPDYATSPDRNDHPFLYTHMPSGPSVLLGSLIQSKLDLTAIRSIFAAISTLGILFFFLFLFELFDNPWTALLGAVTLSFTYESSLVWSDHFVHSFHWFTVFGSAYCFLKFTRLGGARWMTGAILFLLVSAMTSLISLVTILLLTGLLTVFQLVERARSRKMFLALLSLGLMFVGVLILRNIAVLGVDVALQELWYTLTNRMIGVPRRQELKEFFQNHNLALWGSNNYKPRVLVHWFDLIFQSLHQATNSILVCLAYLYFTSSPNLKQGWKILKTMVCVVVGVGGWYLIFSAHGQNYTLPFIGRMIWALSFYCAAQLFIVVFSERDSFPWKKYWKQRSFPKHAQIYALIILAVGIGVGDRIKISLKNEYNFWQEERQEQFRVGALNSFSVLKQFKGETIWTNLNSITVSFFTQSKIIGTCTNKAFLDLKLDECFAILISNSKDKLETLKSPTLFLIATTLVSSDVFNFVGNQYIAFNDEMSKRYKVVAKGEAWTLYRVREL